jgi:hypothetical protein
VACVGLELLLRIGGNPIVFLGIDFSFPFSRPYASDTFEDRRVRAGMVGAGYPSEFPFEEDSPFFYLEGNLSGKVKSQLNLFRYRTTLEGLIQTNPAIRFYSLRSHGSRIRGTLPVRSPGEVPESRSAVKPSFLSHPGKLIPSPEMRETLLRHLQGTPAETG